MDAPQLSVTNYLIQKTDVKFKPKILLVFFAIAAIAWVLNLFGQVTFPSQNLVPFIVRSLISGFALIIVLFTNLRSLKISQLPDSSLGLEFSAKSFKSFLLGLVIGVVAMVILGLLIYLFVPYHFINGPMSKADVFKTSFSYLLSNTTEELIFRGFPLIILSQTIGWRKAVLIIAFAFGLFHLPGSESVTSALSIVTTTSLYGLIFSCAFILTGSLWAAIGTHVVSNIILHLIFGLDGANNAIFVPVFDAKWPSGYDLGLILYIITSIGAASVLYICINRKSKTLLAQHIKI